MTVGVNGGLEITTGGGIITLGRTAARQGKATERAGSSTGTNVQVRVIRKVRLRLKLTAPNMGASTYEADPRRGDGPPKSERKAYKGDITER